MEPVRVVIKQDIPGMEGFICSWICGRDPNIIIDVGPSSTIGRLSESLLAINMQRIDFVLLSHIHIDHAGGLADFLDRFPTARVMCHAKGIRHLVDPSKLWEASLMTLGDLARSYGPMRPVKEEKFIPHTQTALDGLQVIETPGHAAHHLSFAYNDNLFAGEAAGVYYEKYEGYLRPASPPPFFMEEFLASIDRLLALRDQPICFAHLGKAASSHNMLRRARDQLFRWKSIIAKELAKGKEDLPERCLGEILRLDPDVNPYHRMRTDEQEREKFFLANAIKGFLGYLEKNP